MFGKRGEQKGQKVVGTRAEEDTPFADARMAGQKSTEVFAEGTWVPIPWGLEEAFAHPFFDDLRDIPGALILIEFDR